ncbi:hypothetical protein GRF29_106g383346 [Pseudopithomyces chartarum]|uniref:NADP-dependent oxidoreductase domain-containing protein n=1 Tax=Pseudopithomyces chartarum TaxID=1892770 RepID=A0AAN6LSX8_9PLEO|nr:hypothetical protein GRF29_106g383346 [Pseudopithomyces chartarum]
MVKINNTEVGQVGFGLMGMSPLPFPPPPIPPLSNHPLRPNLARLPPSESQSFSAMKTALTHNSTFWNGGELYGTPSSNSLQLLTSYFTAHPSDASKVVLSIKGGCIPGTMAQPDGSAANIRRSIDECLRVLDGKKSLDLFEAARLDPNVPVEETVGAIVEYIREGKVGGLSLSEVNAATIRKTGQFRKFEDIPEDSMLRHMPRFQPDVFDDNIKLLHEVEKIAEKKNATPGQVALGWVIAHSGKNGLGEIIPIPGATTEERVKENTAPAKLTDEDMKVISDILKKFPVQGHRYPAALQGHLEQ